MASPDAYWWYLRAFAVARAGDKLSDSYLYTEINGGFAGEERVAAIAVAALDATTGKGIRSRPGFLAELQTLTRDTKPGS